MKKKLFVLTLAILGLAMLPRYVFAEIEPVLEEEITNELELLTPEEEVEIQDDSFKLTAGEDVFLANDSVTSSDDVEGDLFAFGGTVVVDGDVEGDAFVSGGTVIVNGEIGGNLFVGGGQVSVYGPVGGKVMIGAGAVTIDSDIDGDVYIGAGTVILIGTFGDDVRIGAGSLDLRGTVADELHANVEAFKKSGDAEIGGIESVVITEKIERKFREPHTPFQNKQPAVWTVGRLFRRMLTIFGWVLAAMLVVKLCPVKTDNLLQRLNKPENWFTGFGLGMATLLCAIPLGIFLLITVIGAPIALLGGISFAFVMLISSLMAKIWIGQKTLKILKQKTTNYWLAATVGVILIELLSLTPLLGWMLRITLMTIALGAFLQMKWDMYQKSRGK